MYNSLVEFQPKSSVDTLLGPLSQLQQLRKEKIWAEKHIKDSTSLITHLKLISSRAFELFMKIKYPQGFIKGAYRIRQKSSNSSY